MSISKILMHMVAIPKMPLHCIKKATKFPKKIVFLYAIDKIKTNAVLRFQQLIPFCFLLVLWSQSAPSSAKKGSYKKVITISFKIVPYKNIVIIVSLFCNISIIYIIICICIYQNLCALQHLFNNVFYQNASLRDIQHIRPFAQSAHATIHSAITQPLPRINSLCDHATSPDVLTFLLIITYSIYKIQSS
jgi:hypothetical protein